MFCTSVAAILLSIPLSSAVSLADGDILISADAKAVTVYDEANSHQMGNSRVPVPRTASGHLLFAGSFPQLPNGLTPEVDDPGFQNPFYNTVPYGCPLGSCDSLFETIPAGSVMVLEPKPLRYYNPTTGWQASVPNGEFVRITGFASASITDVTVDGVEQDKRAVVGVACTDCPVQGSLHEHISFRLIDKTPDRAPAPAVGAYLLELTISGVESLVPFVPRQAASQPFYILFNHGLNARSFADAAEALDGFDPQPTHPRSVGSSTGGFAADGSASDAPATNSASAPN